MTLLTILLFFLFLSLVIVIHELGHFLTAKAFGVYCHEFSVGMGPLVAQKQIGETRFSIRAIPMGGYVAMAGESEIPGAPELPKERTLVGIAKWKRAIVLSAGVVLNILLAYVILVGFIANMGVTQELSYVHIAEDSILADAGLVTGDRITAASITLLSSDGVTVIESSSDAQISEYSEFVELLNDTQPTALGQVQCMTLTIDGEGVIAPICRTITTYEEDSAGHVINLAPLFGVSPTTRSATFGETFILAAQVEWDMATMIVAGLGSLFTPGGFDNVSGPVGMVQASFDFINMGMWYYLYFWAIISINLGVFNLLPIPGLDGARLVFTAIEGITGKPVNPKIEMTIHAIGLLLLFGLMILITFKDVFTLF